MSLSELTKQNFAELFFKTDSKRDEENVSPMKLFSTDQYQDVIKELKGKYTGIKDGTILANVGGSDAVLSLYANLAQVSNPKFPPHLLVVDRKISNLQNFIFRYSLAGLHNQRKGYLMDLFDTTSKQAKAFLEESSMAMEDIISDPKYNQISHGARIFTKFRLKRRNITSEELNLFEDSVNSVLRTINSPSPETDVGLRADFIKGMFDTMKLNPEVHYLKDEELYHQFAKNIKFGSNRQLVHAIHRDMTSEIDFGIVQQIINQGISPFRSQNSRPINISLIQNLEKTFENIVPFLSEESEFTIHRHSEKSGNKKWFFSDSSTLLPSSNKFDGITKYEEEEQQRTPLTNIGPFNEADGLENTLFASNILLGDGYSSATMLGDLSDMANLENVKKIITSNGISGPSIYRNKDARQRKRPMYKTFDSQLRAFKRFQESLNGGLVYILGSQDQIIISDLKTLYTKEVKAKKTEKMRPGLDPSILEENFKSVHDEAERIIEKYVYPTMLRSGLDPTLFTAEVENENQESIITLKELVEAFKRHDYQSKPTKRDLEIFDYLEMENTPQFSVFSEYSSLKENPEGVGIRGMPNTKFSGNAEYANPADVLEFLAKTSGKLLKDQIPEHVLADMGQSYHFLKIEQGRALLTMPSMADDRRQYDIDFLRGRFKHAAANKTHKRTAQKKRINVPGGTIINGDPRHKMNMQFIFPKITEKIREHQKRLEEDPNYHPTDKTFMVIQDTQGGSLGERMEMNVRSLDYGIYKKGAIAVLGIGDRMQGRNFKSTITESGITGGMNTRDMQQALVELSRPYFMHPQIKFWGEVVGNHEWNSDRDGQGHHHLQSLESALKSRHMTDVMAGKPEDQIFRYAFPKKIELKDGSILEEPLGMININGYKIVYGHTFGKKSGHASMGAAWWAQRVNNILDVDLVYMGHFHGFEVVQEGNVLCAMLGCQAGETSFELDRGLTSEPRVAYVTIEANGIVNIETLSEEELGRHEIQNPYVLAQGGIENFIQNAIDIEVHRTHELEEPERVQSKPIYQRKLIMKNMPTL